MVIFPDASESLNAPRTLLFCHFFILPLPRSYYCCPTLGLLSSSEYLSEIYTSQYVNTTMYVLLSNIEFLLHPYHWQMQGNMTGIVQLITTLSSPSSYAHAQRGITQYWDGFPKSVNKAEINFVLFPVFSVFNSPSSKPLSLSMSNPNTWL